MTVLDERPTRVAAEFWFDPMCPWAWITSRWIKEVEQVRAVDVRFRVMSLAHLNADKADLDDGYRAWLAEAWGPVRVSMAVGQQHGDEALDRFYTELGTRFHVDGLSPDEATYRAALEAAGLPADLAAAAADSSLDEAVIASHRRGVDQVGDEVGTPVIAFDGHAFFGPVVTPIPRGEDAGRLWDGVALVVSTPGFFELKRTRDARPDVG